ncbi:hypothetical protein [Hyphomicrobium facile]|uniref:Uncharacterized protein n=1 Tax=Hyphomicrobium facile TaxID=51670 RepID=A0A1I7NV32_9HYPH|nr:hypothetical protein [Hyphomicrobium facile]SFV38443.1 hypothetical protein SAMN04488557_3669 [Hyphomicrobium facile]
MPRHLPTNSLRLAALAVAALIYGLIGLPGESSAKHHKTPVQSSSDPCAEPTAFVEQHIAKIKQLQGSLELGSDNVVGWIQHLEGEKTLDPDKVAKLADLRHDADRVNELLRAGGCKTVDIDHELNPAHAASTISPSK